MDLEMIRDFREKLRQLERQVGWQLKDDTECCGVTLAQCHIIVEIGNAGETSVIDLATILGLDTSTLSRHVNGMVNVGLVNRILNPRDRRYVSITLTEQGQKVYQSIEDICNSKYARVFEFIPREKHRQVLECFSLLVHAIAEAKVLEGDLRCCGNDPGKKTGRKYPMSGEKEKGRCCGGQTSAVPGAQPCCGGPAAGGVEFPLYNPAQESGPPVFSPRPHWIKGFVETAAGQVPLVDTKRGYPSVG